MKIQVLLAAVARRAVVLAFIATVCGLHSFAQNLDPIHLAPTISTSDASTDSASEHLHVHTRPMRVDVDLVLVPTTVTDSLNRPVTTLRKQDFALYEGEELQEIRYFNEEDTPLSIGILLDTSGSMKNKFDIAREAVSQFFANANRDDDYFVITFSDKPAVLADTTQSVETIEAELENVVPAGGTPLLDAIYLGLTKLRHARYQRRALLIISDGGDNDSRYRTREIRAMAQESDAQIYAMGIFSPVTISIEDWAGKKLLNQITDATGGRAVFLSSAGKLPQVSAEFSRELRTQYVLGYRPRRPEPDGQLHKIKVRLAALDGRRVQLYYKHEYLASK